MKFLTRVRTKILASESLIPIFGYYLVIIVIHLPKVGIKLSFARAVYFPSIVQKD